MKYRLFLSNCSNCDFKGSTGQLDNVMKFRQVRRDLARIKTVLTEKGVKN